MYERYVLRSEINEILAEGAIMAAGVPGGQTWYGGTGAGETANIYSTTHATKGGVALDGVTVGQGGGGIGTNIAIGIYALGVNTTGYRCVAVGVHALHSNVDGYNNVAVGVGALYSNTNGHYNVGIGDSALSACSVGTDNIAIGVEAMFYTTTGSLDVAIGSFAGAGITTGTNLICIGYNAQPSAGDAANEITLGNTNIATLRCKVTSITAISDRRDKADIRDLLTGLDFVRALQPRRFRWAIRNASGEQTPGGAEDIGFIAQELDEIQTKHGSDLGLVMKENADRWEATPGRLLPVAIRAIQELAAKIDTLEKKIAIKE